MGSSDGTSFLLPGHFHPDEPQVAQCLSTTTKHVTIYRQPDQENRLLGRHMMKGVKSVEWDLPLYGRPGSEKHQKYPQRSNDLKLQMMFGHFICNSV